MWYRGGAKENSKLGLTGAVVNITRDQIITGSMKGFLIRKDRSGDLNSRLCICFNFVFLFTFTRLTRHS